MIATKAVTPVVPDMANAAKPAENANIPAPTAAVPIPNKNSAALKDNKTGTNGPSIKPPRAKIANTATDKITNEPASTPKPFPISSQDIPPIDFKAFDNITKAVLTASKPTPITSIFFGISLMATVTIAKDAAIAAKPRPNSSQLISANFDKANENITIAFAKIVKPIAVDIMPLGLPDNLINKANSARIAPIAIRPCVNLAGSIFANCRTANASILRAIPKDINPADLTAPDPLRFVIVMNIASSANMAPIPRRPCTNFSGSIFDIIVIAVDNNSIAPDIASNCIAIFVAPPVLPPGILSNNAIDPTNSVNITVIAPIATVNLAESIKDKAINDNAKIPIAVSIVKSVFAFKELCQATRLPLTPSKRLVTPPEIPLNVLAPSVKNFLIDKRTTAMRPSFITS